jgi:Pectate lyase superfamily protein
MLFARFLLALVLLIIGAPLATAESYPERPLSFPAYANLINVRDFGAVGDGVHDDTDALIRALNYALLPSKEKKPPRFNVTVLLPAGTYLVSDTIDYGNSPMWTKRATLQGVGSRYSVIKLCDHADKFQDATAPRPVLSTFSGGSTNQAFEVQINNLSIDIGKGNPGATGLRFIANNVGGLRDVRIASSDKGGAGAIGLDLTKAWVGPALLDGVSIDGFDTGISTWSAQYGVTFRHLVLEHQQSVGFFNRRDSVVIDGLISHNVVPVFHNAFQGFIALVRGQLIADRPTGQPAIINDAMASLHMVDTVITGYAVGKATPDGVTIGSEAPRSFAVMKGVLHTDIPAFDLPSPEFDEPAETPPEQWRRVDGFTGEAIQQALNSGRDTIYLPVGLYTLSGPLVIPSTVRRVIGFVSQLKLAKAYPAGAPVITIEPERKKSLILERLDLWTGASLDTIWISNQSHADLLIRDTLLDGFGYRGAGSGSAKSGRVFFINVGGAKHMEFDHQDVFAWQLNPESMTTKILNKGGRMTIYGLKIEGSGVVIANDHGDVTVFGGEIFINANIPTDMPAFDIDHGRTCASTVEVSNFPKNRGYTQFTVLMGSTANGTQMRMTGDYLKRGDGTRVYPAVCAP